MSGVEDVEQVLATFAENVTAEWRAGANVSPLVVRICTTNVQDVASPQWEAYVADVMTLLTGGALDVSATRIPSVDGRRSLQVTFVVPDDGHGTNFRNLLAAVASRHGIKPYSSWTEVPARLRLDHW